MEICITYDYIGSRGTNRSFWEDLEQHNIKVRPFNPIPWWTVIRANNRDHRKIILIDREIGLIGDFGIGNHYAGDGNSNGSWRVSALLIKGPAIKDLVEVLLATNPTMEGEATALYIKKKIKEGLQNVSSADQLKITRIGSGLPVGADLSYADEVTLTKALNGRGDY